MKERKEKTAKRSMGRERDLVENEN